MISTEVTLKKYGNLKLGAEKGMLQSNLAIAIAITAQAKALAPVKSGHLRNSIMWKAGKREGGLEEGERLTTQVQSNEAIVGSAVKYAVYQEYGTRRMYAQPYLRPAVIIIANRLKPIVEQKTNAELLNEINSLPEVKKL